MSDLSIVQHFGNENLRLYNNPALIEYALEKYANDLARLKSSLTDKPDWPYADVVRTAHELISAPEPEGYGTKKDNSGEPAIKHAEDVGDLAFCLSRLYGYNEKEATTVWCAGVTHDYPEMAKEAFKNHPDKDFKKKIETQLDSDDPQEVARGKLMVNAVIHTDLRRRIGRMDELFGDHDEDVINLVAMVTKISEEDPYLIATGSIGNREGFSENSTPKAELGSYLIKFSDGTSNLDPKRNTYLSTIWQTEVDRHIEADEWEKASRKQAKINRKTVKSGAHEVTRDMMALKADHMTTGGVYGIPGDMPATTFIMRTEEGKKYQADEYRPMRYAHLGVGNFLIVQNYIDRNSQTGQGANGDGNIAGHHQPTSITVRQRPPIHTTALANLMPPEAA